jgi:hypothetical protein
LTTACPFGGLVTDLVFTLLADFIVVIVCGSDHESTQFYLASLALGLIAIGAGAYATAYLTNPLILDDPESAGKSMASA